MIQLRDDSDFNKHQRIGHNGTFNANPLSAAAGVETLQLIKNDTINIKANKAAERLKSGLNDMLSNMEIVGTATGVASAIFLRVGIDVDPDDDEIVFTEEQEHTLGNSVIKDQLTLAMYNHGVDAGPRFIVSSIHTDSDINETIESTSKALSDLRNQGLV